MGGLEEEAFRLGGFYQKQIMCMTNVAESTILRMLFPTTLGILLEKSLLGNFKLVGKSYDEAKRESTVSRYIEAGLDYAYRAGMTKRINEMVFFEDTNIFTKEENEARSIECMMKAAKMYGEGKEYAELYLDNIKNIVNIFENIEFEKKYKPYNLSMYSVKEIVLASEEINKLIDKKAGKSELIRVLDNIKKPYEYLIKRFGIKYGNEIGIKDDRLYRVMNNLSNILDRTGEVYEIKMDNGIDILELNTGVYKPLKPQKAKEIDSDDVIDLHKTLNSSAGVREFLSKI